MKLRFMLLVLAMIAVFGAVEYRLSNPLARQQLLASDEYPLALAPSFAGYDQEMHLFRLKSYLGRQAMFVVFCGENKKADTDPNVSHLVRHLDELNSQGIRVVVVTPNLPQENRKIDLPDDFDLVSDFEQTKTGELYKAHKAFRSFDSKSKKPLAKVFFIDRAGNVPVNEGVPVGLLNPDSDIDRLLDVVSTH